MNFFRRAFNVIGFLNKYLLTSSGVMTERDSVFNFLAGGGVGDDGSCELSASLLNPFLLFIFSLDLLVVSKVQSSECHCN